jgi:hypothetical protein
MPARADSRRTIQNRTGMGLFVVGGVEIPRWELMVFIGHTVEPWREIGEVHEFLTGIS